MRIVSGLSGTVRVNGGKPTRIGLIEVSGFDLVTDAIIVSGFDLVVTDVSFSINDFKVFVRFPIDRLMYKNSDNILQAFNNL